MVELDVVSTADIRHSIRQARLSAVIFAVLFAALAALVAYGATDAVDRHASKLAQEAATHALDLAASAFTILGQSEVTAPIAVILAFVWWRRRGLRGLVPLLLFVGVALEVVFKHVVPHPSPPHELSRAVEFLPFLKSSSAYSFPSGHMLRTTFLAGLMLNHWVFWPVIVLMGITRVYLNEHWLSDVVGGWLLGLVLAGVAAAIYGGPAPDDD